MSIESMVAALHHSKAKGTAKLVLLGIANHCGDGGAFPAMATLARYAGVDIKNARNAVRKLEELGEVRTFEHGGKLPDRPNNYQPNRYEVLVKCPVYCDGTMNHRDIRKPLLDVETSSGVSARTVSFSSGDLQRVARASAPDKPVLNLTTQLKEETLVNAREVICLKSPTTRHIFDEASGWCNFCEAREDKVA